MDVEMSHDVGVETVNPIMKQTDRSGDEMDSVTSSVDGHLNSGSMMPRSDGTSHNETQSTKNKVNDSSDVRVKKKLKSSITSESTTVSVVLDEKTGQLVVSEEKDGTNERNTDSSVSKDMNEFVRYDASYRDDVQSSDGKVNESPADICNVAYLVIDEKTGEYFISETAPAKKYDEVMITDKVASVSTNSTGHVRLHVPVEEQQKRLSGQMNPEFVLAKPIVRQASNQAATETKKLRVWSQSLVDIGSDIVKSTILQHFIDLQNKKLNTGKLPDIAKVQLESAKKSQEELYHLTEHLNVRMTRRCKLCRFRTESSNVMHWHQQHPHTDPRSIVSCSYCTFTTRNVSIFENHMQTDHMEQAFFERKTKKYECSLCNYKTSSPSKYLKHKTLCERTFQLITNLCPTSSHVTYCLHDGMFLKPRVQSFPPYKLSQPQCLPNQTPVDKTANVSNASYNRANPANVSKTSLQQQLSSNPTVQPVSSFLNRRVQQQLPIRQTIQPVTSFNKQRTVGEDSFDTMFTGSASQQPGMLSAMLNELTVNPNMIPQFLSDPDMSQYNVHHQKQLTHLQQLREQNAQAMQILKQQDQLLENLENVNAAQKTPMQTNAKNPAILKTPMQTNAESHAIVKRPMQNNAKNPAIVKTPMQTNAVTPAIVQTSVSSDNIKASRSPTISDNHSTRNDLTICEICQGFVKSRTALRLHLLYAHKVSISDRVFTAGTPSFWCSLCQGRFWSRQGLNLHKAICKPICTVVPVLLPTPFIGDTQQNKTITKHKCFICDSPVISILDHMEATHGLTWADFVLPLNKRKCVACGLIFRSYDLPAHMSYVHGLILVKPGKSQTFPMKNCPPNPFKHRYIQCEVCKYLVKTESYQHHVEKQHLKVCHVTVKRLSVQQIKQYTSGKHRKLNVPFHVSGD